MRPVMLLVKWLQILPLFSKRSSMTRYDCFSSVLLQCVKSDLQFYVIFYVKYNTHAMNFCSSPFSVVLVSSLL